MASFGFRSTACALSALQLAVGGFLFALVSEVGSAYVMTRGGDASVSPAITTYISVPLLCVAPSDPHNRPVVVWWFWLVWGVLLVVPVVTAIAVARAPAVESAARRFSLGSWLQLTWLIAIAVVILIGCVLPHACL